MGEKKHPDYAKGRYTTIKIRVELAELFDKWIEQHPELKYLNLDNRSGAFQYIITRLLFNEGLIDEVEVNLGKPERE